jgi:predicted Fe-S protein YdhL (DUF1289 family)
MRQLPDDQLFLNHDGEFEPSVEVAEWMLQMQQLTGCLKRRKEWTQWTSFSNSEEKKASSRCEPQLKEYRK